MLQVWATTTGTVLCADDRFTDWFGLSSRELVGRSISSLSTDIEGFDRWAGHMEPGAAGVPLCMLGLYDAPRANWSDEPCHCTPALLRNNSYSNPRQHQYPVVGLPPDVAATHPVAAAVVPSACAAAACRFIASCSELPAEQVVGGALRMRTKLLHKYLSPVEAEVRALQDKKRCSMPMHGPAAKYQLSSRNHLAAVPADPNLWGPNAVL